MVITFTLQAAYSGATYVAGPFNISGTTNTGTVTELANNVSKAALLTGYTISNINDATTGGTINSTGTCTNSIPWLANPEPEPTVYTYDCIGGSCVEVEGTGGTYGTLQLCQGSCSGGGGDTWDCTPQGCVQAVDGDYATLQDCQNAPCVQGPIE
jgi:hypothetical protein